MNIHQLKDIAQDLGGIFSLQQLQLYEPDFLRNNLVRRTQQGDMIRITKGRYCLTKPKNELQYHYFSNKIYEPSYISMESALRYYDLIPEGVFMITACTTKKTQTLSGDMASFYYYHLKPTLFRGYVVMGKQLQCYYMAQVEKALCDFFYLKNKLTPHDIKELRIDTDQLRELTTPQKLMDCALQFHNKRVLNMVTALISSS